MSGTAWWMTAVIINERGAQALWPGRDPLGQQILWGTLEQGKENPYCTVVGVVSNVKHVATEGDIGMELYYPHTHYPISTIHYVVSTVGRPEDVDSAVRHAIRDVAPMAVIVFVKPMELIVLERLWQRRLWGVLFERAGERLDIRRCRG